MDSVLKDLSSLGGSVCVDAENEWSVVGCLALMIDAEDLTSVLTWNGVCPVLCCRFGKCFDRDDVCSVLCCRLVNVLTGMVSVLKGFFSLLGVLSVDAVVRCKESCGELFGVGGG